MPDPAAASAPSFASAAANVVARAAPPRPAVAVVVLTWNGTADTLACLASLTPQLRSHDRVFVVDNGSRDDVGAALRGSDARVVFVANGENLGFAGGNNVGLRAALAGSWPWVLVLNNDTVLDAGALDAMLRAAERLRGSEPRFAVAQPVLVRADRPDVVDSCGQRLGRLPGARDLLAGEPVAHLPRAPVEIFGPCGAATLLHHDALRQVVGYDEALFVLFEDTDLAFRLRALGFRTALLPEVRVRHKRGVSAGGRDRGAMRQRKFWVQRNVVALALRYWPLPALLAAAPVLAWRVLCALWLRRGRCLPLWSQSLRARRRVQQQLRTNGAHTWFGVGLRALGDD